MPSLLTTLRSSFAGGLALLLSAVMPAPSQAEIVVSKIDIGLPNTVALQIRGAFDGNEILRLKSVIADIDPKMRIVAVLDSPGGNVIQGEALGRYFYDASIPTVVLAGSICASACTYAFFGGRDPVNGQPLRILATGAKLGFHNFAVTNLPQRDYTKAELEDLSRGTQQVVYRNLLHLMHVKAPLKVMELNTGTRNEDVNFITEGDALEYGITVLNRETGKLISPTKLEQRMHKE